MTDIVSPDKRSRMMAGIKGKDTRPEIIIRKSLHRKGFRFRVHVRKLPGNPDIVFPKYNAVVLVHGCFWHGHDCCLFKWPSSNETFWKSKINGNRDRDIENYKKLRGLGWRVLTVWECALKGREKYPQEELIEAIEKWLLSGDDESELRGRANGPC